MNINQFYSKIKNYILSNNFEVHIIPPKILYFNTNEIKFYAYSVTIPNITLSSMETVVLGRKFKKAGTKDFDVSTIMFYTTEDNKIINIFNEWIEKILNYNKGIIEYFDKYSTDIYVKVLDKNKNDNITIKFEDSYPSSLSFDTLSWDSKDILKITVNFIINNIKIIGA